MARGTLSLPMEGDCSSSGSLWGCITTFWQKIFFPALVCSSFFFFFFFPQAHADERLIRKFAQIARATAASLLTNAP
jgi:hypothetical protein